MPELQNVLVFVPASIDEDGAMKILQPFQSHFGQLEAPLGSAGTPTALPLPPPRAPPAPPLAVPPPLPPPVGGGGAGAWLAPPALPPPPPQNTLRPQTLQTEELADALLARLRSAVQRHGVAPMHLFRVLDVKGRGFLWPKDLARLAWAMEPNLGFQELSAFWRLLGGEGDRLRPRPFCRALQVAVSPTSPTSKPSKPTWRQIGRSYAAQPSRALSFAPTAVSAQQALEAFVQKWKPKSKLAAKAGAPPGAPPSAPPAPGAPPMAASAAPGVKATPKASLKGSASYSSEDFEEDRYSEGTRYTDSSSGKGSK
ncbi:unnamed protein product [Durusdinium trenchii]|uniref:Calmodulin n=1 Tax=Durusdinium trenchii TaxID=1381693 RepID=A0ABP0J0V3_9DINO